MKPERDHYDVVICGGGISGLAASLRAAQLGLSSLALEKSAKTGGLWGSAEFRGFVFDYGVHGLYAAGPETEEIVAYLKKLIADEFVRTEKKTKILFKGQLLNYPLLPVEFFTKYGFEGFLWAATLVFARLRTSLVGESWMRSFRDYITGNFGGLLYRIYFEKYVTKVWGVDPAYLDLDSVARRVKKIRMRTFLTQLFRKALRLGQRSTYDGMQPFLFAYPRRGAQMVVDSLRREAEKGGAEILTGASVKSIAPDGPGYVVEVSGPGGEDSRVTAKSVVSSVPLPDLLSMIRPGNERLASEARSGLRYRALKILNILIDCDKIFDAQWMYFQGEEFRFSRLNEYKNLSSEFCPEGKTSLSIEFNCDVGDELWSMPDDKLYEIAVTDLDQPIGGYSRVGTLVRGNTLGYFSVGLTHAYPLMKVETHDVLRRSFAYLEKFPCLHSIGRQGRFCYVNGDECVKMAFDAVESIKNALGEGPG